MRTALKIVGLAASIFATPAIAQEQAGGGQISLELNRVKQVETGCELTFLTSSGSSEGVEQVMFEAVLFDTSGAVSLLTLFDFGALPAGRPRVRQFVIPEQKCDALGRILINGVTRCKAAGLSEAACAAGLGLSTRTDVELIG